MSVRLLNSEVFSLTTVSFRSHGYQMSNSWMGICSFPKNSMSTSRFFFFFVLFTSTRNPILPTRANSSERLGPNYICRQRLKTISSISHIKAPLSVMLWPVVIQNIPEGTNLPFLVLFVQCWFKNYSRKRNTWISLDRSQGLNRRLTDLIQRWLKNRLSNLIWFVCVKGHQI